MGISYGAGAFLKPARYRAGARAIASISVSPSNPIVGVGDSLLYVVTVAPLGLGSVDIAQSGDLSDGDFDVSLVAAIAAAVALTDGVSFDGVNTLTFDADFQGILLWSRTIEDGDLGDTHVVTLSNPIGLMLGIASASVALTEEEVIPTPTGAVPAGVNLASGEFSSAANPGVLGTNYIYPSNLEIDYYYAKGMRNFRVPFKAFRLQHVLNGALSEPDIAALEAAADHIATLPDAVMIPGCHDFGVLSGVKWNDPSLGAAKLADMWIRIVARLGPAVRIGLMNEPKLNEPPGADNYIPTEWRDFALEVIGLLRTAGVTNTIMVPGTAYTGARSWVTSGNADAWAGHLPANCIIEVHQYLDEFSSGTSTEATPGAGSTRLVAVTAWARAEGYKLFLGEFGFANNAGMFTEARALLSYMEANVDVWDSWTAWAGGLFWATVYPYLLEPIGGVGNPVDRPQLRLLMDYALPIAVQQPPSDIGLSNTASTPLFVQGAKIGNWSVTDPNPEDSHDAVLTNTAGGRYQIVGRELQAGPTAREVGQTNVITIEVRDRGGNVFARDFGCPVLPAPSIALSRTSPTFVNEGANHTFRLTFTNPVPGAGFDFWCSGGNPEQFTSTWDAAVRSALEAAGCTVTNVNIFKVRVRFGPATVSGQVNFTWQTLADHLTEGAVYQANFFIDNPLGFTIGSAGIASIPLFINDTSLTPGWTLQSTPGVADIGQAIVFTLRITDVAVGAKVTITGEADSDFETTLDAALAAAVAGEVGLTYNSGTNQISVTGAWDGILTWPRTIAVGATGIHTTTLSAPVNSDLSTSFSVDTVIRTPPALEVVEVDFSTDIEYQPRAGNLYYQNVDETWQAFADDVPPLGDQGLQLGPTKSNLISNPRGQGGTPGTTTFPTDWSLPGWVFQARGVEDGIPYVDVKRVGLPTGNGQLTMGGLTPPIPVALNVPYTLRFGIKLVAGSANGLNYLLTTLNGRTTAGAAAQILQSKGFAYGPADIVWYDFTGIFTVGTVAKVWPQIQLLQVAGASLDVTLRIYAPMLSQDARPMLVVLPDVSGISNVGASRALLPLTPAAEGTIVLDIDVIGRQSGDCYLSLFSDDQNFVELQQGGKGKLRLVSVVGGVTVVDISGGFVSPQLAGPAGTRTKVGFRYGGNDYGLVFDGVEIGVASVAAVPAITEINLGCDHAGANAALIRFRALQLRNDFRLTSDLITDTRKAPLALSPGVNLAGPEFTSTNTSPSFHGFYESDAGVDYHCAKGIKHFRLPVLRWRMQRVPFGDLDATGIAKVRAVLDRAALHGVKVFIDNHEYSRYDDDGPDAWADFWTKFATQFAGHPGLLGYDPCNEPGGVAWWTYLQAAADIILAIDPTAKIFAEGLHASAAFNWTDSSYPMRDIVIPDANLICSSHCYFDSNRSGQYQQSFTAGGTDEEATPVLFLRPFLTWLRAFGKDGDVGESGVPRTDARWLVLLDNAIKILHEHAVVVTYWAGGPAWGEYILTIEPSAGPVDRPQMDVLEKYTASAEGFEASLDFSDPRNSGYLALLEDI